MSENAATPRDSKKSPSEKSGLAALGESSTGQIGGHPLLRAMGGILGIAETVFPGFVFLVVYAVSGFPVGMPWLALGLSVAVSACFTAWRLIRRQPVTQAIAGLLAVGGSAALALWSNRPENNFLIGIFTNAGYGLAFLVSVVVGWPLVGVVVGYARQEGTTWRKLRHHRRVFSGVTLMWVGMFALRLAVEVPLFLVGDVGALAVTKLALGLPLYVPVLALSWLIIRSLYREK